VPYNQGPETAQIRSTLRGTRNEEISSTKDKNADPGLLKNDLLQEKSGGTYIIIYNYCKTWRLRLVMGTRS
jgi:hypothetical protein